MWYVIVILLGFIGGIPGYVRVKNDDPNMAKNLLIVGITTTPHFLLFFHVFFKYLLLKFGQAIVI
jgi:hypothetical protein